MWHSESEKLYWLDIPSGVLRAYDPANASVRDWKLERPSAGLVAEPSSTNLLVGQGATVLRFDLQTASTSAFDELPEPRGNERINDLKTDTLGNLWVATMDADGQAPIGRLLRRTVDGTWQVLLDEVPIVNGPALAGDGHTVDQRARGYVADTANRRIFRFSISVAEVLHPAELTLFAQFTETDGYPDGMTLDAQNCLWVAHYDGACVSRWSPAGECLQRVTTPAKHMTSVALAGDRLYMTSAARAGVRSRDAGGALFALDISEFAS